MSALERVDVVVEALQTGRQRTLDLLAPLDEDDLVRQHSPLMSPLVWDLAHVGNYEDLWLLRGLGAPGVGAHLDDLYDAFRHPRRDRPALPLLGPDAARAYIAEVRSRVLDGLDRGPSTTVDDRLLHHGFVYGMVVQHEHQHDETMLATLQLMTARPDCDPSRSAVGLGGQVPQTNGRTGVGTGPERVVIPGGPFVMGTSTEPWAYDNERPARVIDVGTFAVGRLPVTNGEYAAFVADGGYDEPRWWTADGWAWRQEAGLSHPQLWERDGGGWLRNRFGVIEPVGPDEPVQHVCWYEADAYCRWAGGRLPTEPEWEKAASWDPARERKRRYPWGDDDPVPGDGRANLGQISFGPTPAGAYPQGASAYGVEQLVGDVWEWTASDFTGHAGYESFPYPEYSEVFFGPEYKVLRGGSWATHPTAVRTTFRNWDYPIRRQIFAGFRCAWDV